MKDNRIFIVAHFSFILFAIRVRDVSLTNNLLGQFLTLFSTSSSSCFVPFSVNFLISLLLFAVATAAATICDLFSVSLIPLQANSLHFRLLLANTVIVVDCTYINIFSV